MAHIFISHSKLDADFVEALKGKLHDEGLDYWVDTEHLEAGMDWRVEIDQAIDSAIAMVVVMTPDAKGSEYVTYEWGYAVGAHKRIIPVLLKPTDLHKRLGAFQYLNFTDATARPWERLMKRLRDISAMPEASRAEGDPFVSPSETEALLPDMTITVPADAPPRIRKAVEVILDNLDETARRDAIQLLANTSGSLPQDLLAQVALFHERRDVRVEASLALAPLGDGRAVTGLIEALVHLQGSTQNSAIWALVNLGDVAVSGLFEPLRSGHPRRGPEIRSTAAEILGRIGDPRALAELVEALDDPDGSVQEVVAKAIIQIRHQWAVPGLLKALEGPGHSDVVRQIVAQALGTVGDPGIVPRLLSALQNPELDFNVRLAVGQAVGHIARRSPTEPVVPMLEEALRAARRDQDRETEQIVLDVVTNLNTDGAKAVIAMQQRGEL